MSTDRPLVSIITPAFNRASFLDETVQSILSQDYPRIEYIVLDDGSTDDTREVLQKYKGKIVFESHVNIGETLTVNKGFGMANGEIVCVVNSDDPLRPGAVSTAVNFMRQHPNALVVYPDWEEIDTSSEIMKEIRLPDYDIKSMLLMLNIAMGPGVFIRREVFDLVGLRDSRLKYAADLDFWFRVALQGQMVHIPHVLATHRVHPSAASTADRGEQMAGELIDVVKRYCDHPNLPSQLRKSRHRVLAKAHWVAVFRCGWDRAAGLSHCARAIRYDPLGLLNLRVVVPPLLFLISPNLEAISRKLWKRVFQHSGSGNIYDLRAR